MPVDVMLFTGNQLRDAGAPATLTVSTTATGYDKENVRRAELFTAWKPGDSTTADEWMKADGGSTTWLGAAGATAYATLAWDTRLSHQDTVKLQYDTADSASFTSPSTLATWTVGTPNNLQVTMEYKSFTIPNPAKRYYRIIQFGNERTETTGNVTAKVLVWAMHARTDVVILSSDYTSDDEAPHVISQTMRMGGVTTASGLRVYNKYAADGHRFTLNFTPATYSLWRNALAGRIRTWGGPQRAIFIQKEGLINVAQENFHLCRMTGAEWSAQRPYVDQYVTEIEFETEPWY